MKEFANWVKCLMNLVTIEVDGKNCLAQAMKKTHEVKFLTNLVEIATHGKSLLKKKSMMPLEIHPGRGMVG